MRPRIRARISARDPDSCRDALQVLGDIEVGLVERERLHERRVLGEDAPDLARDRAVDLEARRHEDEVRAQPQRGARGHGRAHAERPGLVAGGGDNAALARAADRDRPAAQRRVVALLHGRVERVHVDVDDLADWRRQGLGSSRLVAPEATTRRRGSTRPADPSLLPRVRSACTLPAATAATTSSAPAGAMARSRRPGRSRGDDVVAPHQRDLAARERGAGREPRQELMPSTARTAAGEAGGGRRSVGNARGGAPRSRRSGARRAEQDGRRRGARDDAGDRLGNVLRRGRAAAAPPRLNRGRLTGSGGAAPGRQEWSSGPNITDGRTRVAPGKAVREPRLCLRPVRGCTPKPMPDRRRCRRLDQALHAGGARQPGDARRRLDVDGQGVGGRVLRRGRRRHGPVGAVERRGDRGLVVRINPTASAPHRPARGAGRALRVAGVDPHPAVAAEQVPDHPAAEEARPPKTMTVPPRPWATWPEMFRRRSPGPSSLLSLISSGLPGSWRSERLLSARAGLPPTVAPEGVPGSVQSWRRRRRTRSLLPSERCRGCPTRGPPGHFDGPVRRDGELSWPKVRCRSAPKRRRRQR